MYIKCFKRFFDILLAAAALVVLSPLFLFLTAAGALAMRGNPFFVQPRPGKKAADGREKIFKMIKFRTMNNKKDENGRLLPDDVRLNGYGRFLRKTSLDEFPEAINILKGDMSVVGPRPQLVRDMVFMTERQRKRHDVRPGLTGLAQINGRNGISWEDKLEYDLEYINGGIRLAEDVRIIVMTVFKAFVKRENIAQDGMETAEDLGDWLLRENIIGEEYYNEKNREAAMLL